MPEPQAVMLRCQPCEAVLQAEHQRQLTLVFQQHTAQVAELQRSTQLEEALKWRQHLAALEGQFQASKERSDRLGEELRAARALVPWTPAAHEVQHTSAQTLNDCTACSIIFVALLVAEMSS